MKIMKLQALIVTLILVGNSHGYSVSEFDQYYADEMGGTEVKCFIKVSLNNCGKGIELRVWNEDTKFELKKTISGKEKSACLEVKCMSNINKKISLSDKFDIGGELEKVYVAKAKPGTLDSQTTNGLYTTEPLCTQGKTSASIVTCVVEKRGPENSQDNSVQVEELENEAFFAAQDNNGNNDFPMRNENGKEIDAFMMNNGDSRYPPPATNFDDEDDHAQVQVLDDKSMQQDDDNDNNGDTSNDKAPDDNFSDAQEMGLVKEGVTAKLQWNNWFRGTLYALCGDRQAIYYAKSAHSNHYEDRIWHFYCKTVADYNYNHCYWTGYQNSYDKPLFAHCGANYMMRGIYSIYSNHHRDRLFQIQCCHAPHHYTRHCFLSGYVNGWDGAMNYGVGGRWAFTGLYSYHSNRREDRIWKVASCYYSR